MGAKLSMLISGLTLSISRLRVPRVIPETCLIIASCHSLPDAKTLFLEVVAHTTPAFCPARRDREDHLLLTARQLAGGTLPLHSKVHSCADLFAVEKSNDRQRTIWNVPSIAEAAQRFLRCHRALQTRQASWRHFFPHGTLRPTLTCCERLFLQPVFGRRCVTVQELMTNTSLPLEEIRRYVVDGPNSVTVDMRVLLASAVLPMGWFLLELVCCESCKLQVAKNAGLKVTIFCVWRVRLQKYSLSCAQSLLMMPC